MSVFAISDLHLSFGADKPMDVFRGWEHYTERIEENWRRLVSPADTVVLAGDTSWSMKLETAAADFAFLDALPGRKILLKGNHDYWWTTVTKMEAFLAENRFDTLHILHNACIPADGFAVCGTRGWLYDGTGPQDEKVIARECGRLEASLAAAEQTALTPALFLHYPPVYGNFVCEKLFDVIRTHEISKLWYGHLHGAGRHPAVIRRDGVEMRLISCDCVDFTPVLIG